jgi:hypothetical protein
MLLTSKLIILRRGYKFDVKTVWARECGLRPLRAAGSILYEPEAIGAYAYAPEGSRKKGHGAERMAHGVETISQEGGTLGR